MKSVNESINRRVNHAPSDGKGEAGLLAVQPQQLQMMTDTAIKAFYDKNCKSVPLNSNNKIRDLLRENDHLVFNLDSIDMWCHIKLFMVQGKYNIDALMDLKIEKMMVFKDLKNML